MILIISDNNDQSTCRVIDWLKFYNCNYILITDDDIVEIIKLYPDGNFLIKIKNKFFSYNDIKSVWYRRGKIKISDNLLNCCTLELNIKNAIKNQINRETNTITNFINYSLLRKKNLNNYLFSSVNKLHVLYEAQKLGLKVPDTLISGCKSEVINFKNKYNDIITKVASEGAYFCSKDYWFFAYTETVTDNMLNILPDTFSPSLFQEKIQKKNEIRSFFLDGKVYSMAIFSQSNNKTQIDYRHYDKELPNRNIPFKLPNSIEDLIKQLMQKLNLNSGSIDFIYAKNNDFYFLEINPIGQFGMVSFPCNYQLEKEIAIYLRN